MAPEPSPAPRGTSSGPPYAPDSDEVDVQKWLVALARRWFVLLAGLVIGGAVGLFAAMRTPTVYEAASTILIVPPPDQTGVFAVPALRALFTNQSIATKTVHDVGLDQPPTSLTPAGFLSRVTIEDLPNTFLVRIKVQLADPNLAAKAANQMAQHVVDFGAALWKETVVTRRGQVEQQAKEARQKLAAAEQQLLDFRQGARIEQLREDADRAIARRGDLEQMATDIDEERARLKTLESELAKSAPRDRSRGALDQQAPADKRPPGQNSMPSRGDGSSDPSSSGSLQDRIEDRIVESRTRLAALEEVQRRLAATAKGSDNRSLNTLYSKESGLTQAEDEVDLLRHVYTEIAGKAEQTKSELAMALPPLRLLDAAVVPEQPLPRGRSRTVIVGMLAGLVLAVCLVIAREWRAQIRR